jgi:hypothetical protein
MGRIPFTQGLEEEEEEEEEEEDNYAGSTGSKVEPIRRTASSSAQ